MYLDPGFGGMLLQILVAIAAAGGVIVFSLRRKIRSLFTKNKETDAGKASVVDHVGDEINSAAIDKSAAGSEDDDDMIDMLSGEKASDNKTTD